MTEIDQSFIVVEVHDSVQSTRAPEWAVRQAGVSRVVYRNLQAAPRGRHLEPFRRCAERGGNQIEDGHERSVRRRRRDHN